MRYVVIFVALLTLSACTPRPFQPPSVCETSDSIILERIPDVKALSQGLLTIQLAALETVEGYTADDAGAVLDQVEIFIDSAGTYASLVSYITNKLEIANGLAGAMVFILGDEINQLALTTPITPCDKALIKAHIARERLLLTLYK